MRLECLLASAARVAAKLSLLLTSSETKKCSSSNNSVIRFCLTGEAADEDEDSEYDDASYDEDEEDEADRSRFFLDFFAFFASS